MSLVLVNYEVVMQFAAGSSMMNLTLRNPKRDLTEAQLKAAAENIITENIFNANPMTKFKGAYERVRQEEEIDLSGITPTPEV